MSFLEQTISNEQVAAYEVTSYDTRHGVRLHITHFRRRDGDIDNFSVKAIVDGIVQTGILSDDSTKQIKEIHHYFVKIKNHEEEKTEVVVEYLKEQMPRDRSVSCY